MINSEIYSRIMDTKHPHRTTKSNYKHNLSTIKNDNMSIEEFARIWREQDLEAANAQLDHVLAVMRVADKLRRSAGIEFPEE